MPISPFGISQLHLLFPTTTRVLFVEDPFSFTFVRTTEKHRSRYLHVCCCTCITTYSSFASIKDKVKSKILGSVIIQFYSNAFLLPNAFFIIFFFKLYFFLQKTSSQISPTVVDKKTCIVYSVEVIFFLVKNVI